MAKNEYQCDCGMLHHRVVAEIQQRMPSQQALEGVAEFYKIMGDPTRCKLIFALSQQEMCVCDLANLLSMTKSAVSHQLGKMRASRIVRCRREGKSVFYSLDDDHVAQIFATTLEHIHHREQEETV